MSYARIPRLLGIACQSTVFLSLGTGDELLDCVT